MYFRPILMTFVVLLTTIVSDAAILNVHNYKKLSNILPSKLNVNVQSRFGNERVTKDPYKYLGCANNVSACSDTMLNQCVIDDPSDPSTWYCNCYCDGGMCFTDKDCCNNMCVNGQCSMNYGSEGTVCVGACFPTGSNECTPGNQCVPYGSYGYCASTYTTPPALTTPSASACQILDCPNKVSGNYADPLHPCSTHYYSCSNGNCFEMPCANFGTYFDQRIDACNWKDQVPACQ